MKYDIWLRAVSYLYVIFTLQRNCTRGATREKKFAGGCAADEAEVAVFVFKLCGAGPHKDKSFVPGALRSPGVL